MVSGGCVRVFASFPATYFGALVPATDVQFPSFREAGSCAFKIIYSSTPPILVAQDRPSELLDRYSMHTYVATYSHCFICILNACRQQLIALIMPLPHGSSGLISMSKICKIYPVSNFANLC